MVRMVRRSEGPKVRRSEGPKVRRSEGPKVRRERDECITTGYSHACNYARRISHSRASEHTMLGLQSSAPAQHQRVPILRARRATDARHAIPREDNRPLLLGARSANRQRNRESGAHRPGGLRHAEWQWHLPKPVDPRGRYRTHHAGRAAGNQIPSRERLDHGEAGPEKREGPIRR